MAPNRRPNILLLIPHDLGTFLHCYGSASVSSPKLDALAGRGVRFTNYFTTCPECTSSRGSLMTGLQPHQNGLMGLAGFGWELRVPHLAGRLRDAGYRTHLFGFQHETHRSPEELGYQNVHAQENRRVGPVCVSVEAFLRDEAEQARGSWFAYCGFFDVHRRWRPLAESRFDPREVEVPAFLPDLPAIRADLARFHQDIEVMDGVVGRLLATLEETGRDRETLVIFTTDHGAAFPNAKATLYDAGVRIPLILHWRGRSSFEGGRVHGQLLSNTDMVPTLLELAGAAVPPGLAGRSFLPLLEGRTYRERESVGGALFYDVAYDPMHYVRTREHKYIRSFAVAEEDARGADPEALTCFYGGRHTRVDDFDVLTAPTWQVFPREPGKPPVEELYDLRADPAEQRNLAGSPEHRQLLERMRVLLRGMMEKTASPLLSGHVPAPERQKEVGRRHRPGGELFMKELEERMKLL